MKKGRLTTLRVSSEAENREPQPPEQKRPFNHVARQQRGDKFYTNIPNKAVTGVREFLQAHTLFLRCCLQNIGYMEERAELYEKQLL